MRFCRAPLFFSSIFRVIADRCFQQRLFQPDEVQRAEARRQNRDVVSVMPVDEFAFLKSAHAVFFQTSVQSTGSSRNAQHTFLHLPPSHNAAGLSNAVAIEV